MGRLGSSGESLRRRARHSAITDFGTIGCLSAFFFSQSRRASSSSDKPGKAAVTSGETWMCEGAGGAGGGGGAIGVSNVEGAVVGKTAGFVKAPRSLDSTTCTKLNWSGE